MEEQRTEKTKFRLTGSLGAKIAAFFFLVLSAMAALVCAVAIFAASEAGLYRGRENLNQAISSVLGSYFHEYADKVWKCLTGENPETAEQALKDSNVEAQLLLIDDEEEIIWQSDKIEENWIYQDIYYQDIDFYLSKLQSSPVVNGTALKGGTAYTIRIFIHPDYPVEDEARQAYQGMMALYDYRQEIIFGFVGAGLTCLLCFIFLMCAAGHKNGREGISPSVLTELHFDVLTGFFAAAIIGTLFVSIQMVDRLSRPVEGAIMVVAALMLSGALLVLYLQEFAVRLKMGKFWKNTFIYIVFRSISRGIRFLLRGFGRLLREIPLVWTTVIAFLGISFLEFLIALVGYRSDRMIVWMLEKIILFPVVIYVALMCRRLQAASRAMAEGNVDYEVETSRMFGAFKEHGDNLNSMSKGISRAVTERMKSEHMKTELITNVSHDLKTPLTSIINYADLICEEKTENPKIAEYSEVLLRQSRRLKKLLEDLIEASKAATGNLEVHQEICEVGVLLSQAVGEYEQRMAERDLKLITSQPEEPVRIMADGRYLWRIFDNLLNNVCKYAQENTRVYVTVEAADGKAAIIFRNMSKYVLNVSSEELTERFVRGDKSRNMEGNGLGLSITRSLMELQGGAMKIIVDGDLFKVILSFDLL